MNNIIKLADWRRASGRLRPQRVLAQDSGRQIDIERAGSTKSPAYQVTAVFAGGEVSFSLSISNTFGDLAERLDYLSDRYSGMPVAVYFKPCRTGQPHSVLK